MLETSLARAWEDFAEKAELLYRHDPVHARYVIKYRHKEGKLVLKVTDNVTCLKYRTSEVQDVKRMEKLNNLFFSLMARGMDESSASAASSLDPAAASVASGPVKKNRRRRQ
eukprot:jgi/Mesvir1/15246/Mv06470-RA.1